MNRTRHLIAWHRDGPLAQHAETLAALAGQACEKAAARSPALAEWRQRNP